VSLLLNFDFLRSYKPVSRILFPSVNSGRYHLSVPIITHRDQSAYPPTRLSASNEQFSRVGLCGISACKVYPRDMLPYRDVSSYLTFSPLPTPTPPRRGWVSSYFLWHYLFPTSRDPALNRCNALCCPDFPPQRFGRDDSLACSDAKL